MSLLHFLFVAIPWCAVFVTTIISHFTISNPSQLTHLQWHLPHRGSSHAPLAASLHWASPADFSFSQLSKVTHASYPHSLIITTFISSSLACHFIISITFSISCFFFSHITTYLTYASLLPSLHYTLQTFISPHT